VREEYVKLLRQLIRRRLGFFASGLVLGALFVSLTIGISRKASSCSSDEPVKKDEPAKIEDSRPGCSCSSLANTYVSNRTIPKESKPGCSSSEKEPASEKVEKVKEPHSGCSSPKKEAEPKKIKPKKEKKVKESRPGCSGPKKELVPVKVTPKKVETVKVTESHPGCSGPKVKPEEVKQEKPVVVKQAPKKPESKYVDGAVEDARRILDIWYPGKHNQKLLEARIQSIKAWSKANGKNIEPCRFLLAAHDAGARTPDNNKLYAGNDDFIRSGGTHKVFGAKWIKVVIGGDYVGGDFATNSALIRALAISIRGDSVVISDEALKGFWIVDPYIGFGNQVGYVPNAPYFDDGKLPANASRKSDGTLFNNPHDGNTVYSTYADGVFATVIGVKKTNFEVFYYVRSPVRQ